MSEPITHIDTDNYMTIHHKGTSYFDSSAHLMCFVTPLKEMILAVQCELNHSGIVLVPQQP